MHRKYKLERELQKIELQFEFRAIELGEESPLFIDTMYKSWSLNENNSDAQDSAMWQAQINLNTSLGCDFLQ